jgi:hypothetical protein
MGQRPGGAAPAFNSKPLRPIGQEAFARLTSSRTIIVTTGRNVALCSLTVINRYISALYDAEEEAAAKDTEPVYPPFPVVELKRSLHLGCINACIDWAIQAIRSLLDWGTVRVCSPELSRRLRKDLRASAFRKDHYSFYVRGPRVARTALFSDATLYMADWVISCCVEIYLALSARLGDQSWKRRARKLLLRCTLQAARCGAAWMVVSLGNGVGSMAPKRYRSFSMFLCAQLAGMGVNVYANAFIARLTMTWDQRDQPPAAPPSTRPPAGPPTPAPIILDPPPRPPTFPPPVAEPPAQQSSLPAPVVPPRVRGGPTLPARGLGGPGLPGPGIPRRRRAANESSDDNVAAVNNGNRNVGPNWRRGFGLPPGPNTPQAGREPPARGEVGGPGIQMPVPEEVARAGEQNIDAPSTPQGALDPGAREEL